jgi:hypothetical protein
MCSWYDKHFHSEYKQNKSALKENTAFPAGWREVVTDLHQLMGTEGFDAGREVSLPRLRRKITEGATSGVGVRVVQQVPEWQGLLAAVDGTEASIGGAAVPKARAAALKFLRHTYLLNRAGNSQVWVHSLPLEFTDWPSVDLDNASTSGAVKTLLASSRERFSADDKKHLASAVQHALAWCQKTGIVLSTAATAGSPPSMATTEARALVKRWFSDPSVTDTVLDTYIAKLAAGFKQIIAALGRGHFVLTDFVPLRKATSADELKFFNSEAFTMRSRYEGMDVVYVENAFFGHDAGGVVHDLKNWIRIVVHELSHLVCGTTDVNGDRYAHSGIGPHAGFPGSDAVCNADSWAFFAADCAGQLTDGNRLLALRQR